MIIAMAAFSHSQEGRWSSGSPQTRMAPTYTVVLPTARHFAGAYGTNQSVAKSLSLRFIPPSGRTSAVVFINLCLDLFHRASHRNGVKHSCPKLPPRRHKPNSPKQRLSQQAHARESG